MAKLWANAINSLLHVVPDTIISIEALGDHETYDFEVEDTHMLSGNGVYTSNSRRGALMLILEDWHPDLIEFICSKNKPERIQWLKENTRLSFQEPSSIIMALPMLIYPLVLAIVL